MPTFLGASHLICEALFTWYNYQNIMIPYAIIFALAVMGVNETTYLLRKRISMSAPVCLIGNDCEKVLMSEQRKILVVPLDIWGLLFYSTIALACALATIGIGSIAFWDVLIPLLVAVGSAFSVLFTYLQWRVIRAWCFWCVTSAFTVWAMGLIILLTRHL